MCEMNKSHRAHRSSPLPLRTLPSSGEIEMQTKLKRRYILKESQIFKAIKSQTDSFRLGNQTFQKVIIFELALERFLRILSEKPKTEQMVTLL